MKILLVEDQSYKRDRLRHILSPHLAQSGDGLDIVDNANDGRRRLQSTQYDVMLLDIVIPLRSGEDPSESNAVELLKDAIERRSYHRPGRIVGLTAYEAAAAAVQPYFAENLWTIVRVDESSDEWIRNVENCIKYLCAREQDGEGGQYGVDLCVVCALADPELSAVLQLPWQWGVARPIDGVTFVNEGTIRCGGKEFSVVASSAPRMGAVSAALVASKLISTFRPRILVMIGVCAGLKGKCQIGDVILAEVSWDYQSGKRRIDGKSSVLEIAPHQIGISESVRTRGELLIRRADVWEKIRREWISPPSNVPKLLVAPLASGSAVLADGETITDVRDHQHRKLAGIDMEVYGIYAAGIYGDPRPITFAMKAVADFADAEKEDGMQAFAAYVSARALEAFLAENLSDLIRSTSGN